MTCSSAECPMRQGVEDCAGPVVFKLNDTYSEPFCREEAMALVERIPNALRVLEVEQIVDIKIRHAATVAIRETCEKQHSYVSLPYAS